MYMEKRPVKCESAFVRWLRNKFMALAYNTSGPLPKAGVPETCHKALFQGLIGAEETGCVEGSANNNHGTRGLS